MLVVIAKRASLRSSQLLKVLALCAVTLLGVSCSISDRWVYEDSEGVVGEQFFASVKRNKTSKAWVLKNLGQPFAVNTGDRGEEIYSYHFKRTHYRRASVLVVFRYDGSESDVEHYHVVFCQDMVRKAWWDGLPEVQSSRLGFGARCPKNKTKDSSKKKMTSMSAIKRSANEQI